MKRRSFLKLVCAAVVAPSLPTCAITDVNRFALLELIERRRDAARDAMLRDFESTLFGLPVGIALDDIPKDAWGWVQVAGEINWKTKLQP